MQTECPLRNHKEDKVKDLTHDQLLVMLAEKNRKVQELEDALLEQQSELAGAKETYAVAYTTKKLMLQDEGVKPTAQELEGYASVAQAKKDVHLSEAVYDHTKNRIKSTYVAIDSIRTAISFKKLEMELTMRGPQG